MACPIFRAVGRVSVAQLLLCSSSRLLLRKHIRCDVDDALRYRRGWQWQCLGIECVVRSDELHRMLRNRLSADRDNRCRRPDNYTRFRSGRRLSDSKRYPSNELADNAKSLHKLASRLPIILQGTDMYGPPRDCKGKFGREDKSAQMYSAFSWRLVLLARMSCARVDPYKSLGHGENHSRYQVADTPL